MRGYGRTAALCGMALVLVVAAGCGGSSWLPGGGGEDRTTPDGVAQSDLEAIGADSQVVGSGEREFVDTLLRRQLEALQRRAQHLSAQLEQTETALEELEQRQSEYRGGYETTLSRIETVRVLMQALEEDADFLNGEKIRRIREELTTEIPGQGAALDDPQAVTMFDEWQNAATGEGSAAVPSGNDGFDNRAGASPLAPPTGTRPAPPPFGRQQGLAASGTGSERTRPMADVGGTVRRPPVAPSADTGRPLSSPEATAAVPVEAEVVAIDGEGQDATVYIDAGAERGVEAGMYFSVGTGREQRAILVVTETYDKASKAVVAGPDYYYGPVERGSRAVRVRDLPPAR